MRLKKRGIEKCLVFLYAWRRTLLMGESSQSGPDNGKDTTKNKGVPFTAMEFKESLSINRLYKP